MQPSFEELGPTGRARIQAVATDMLSRRRWPTHTNPLEGINNLIKVIKRMTYGYPNGDHFFRKIKATFPTNP